MTNLGAEIFFRLSANVDLSAIVASRIYPGHLPTSVTFPAVVYHVISDVPVSDLSGYTSGLRRTRVQIDCYDRVYSTARAAADRANDVLSSVTEQDFCSVRINGRDLFQTEGEGADGLYRVSQDFSVWVRDA